VSDNVVMRLVEPWVGKGRHFFTSLSPANKFLAKKTSLDGTMNKMRLELPPSAQTRHLHSCCMPSKHSISEIYRQFLGLHAIVSALTCTVNCGTLYRQVCFLLNHVQTIELATSGLQSSCTDVSRMIKGNWMHLSSIWSVIAKRCEYFCKLDFCMSFSIHFFTVITVCKWVTK
jgi:hypothetical protein